MNHPVPGAHPGIRQMDCEKHPTSGTVDKPRVYSAHLLAADNVTELALLIRNRVNEIKQTANRFKDLRGNLVIINDQAVILFYCR